MRSNLVLVSLLLSTLAVPAVTLAQPKAKPPEVEDEKKAAARAHYDAGRRAYNMGEFDRSIEEWKAGYDLNGDALFLFNIGQAYRQIKNYDRAIFFFKSYLRESPSAENRDAVEARIAEMEKLVSEQENANQKPPGGPSEPAPGADKPPAATPPAAKPAQPSDDDDEDDDDGSAAPAGSSAGKGLRLGGLISAGVGAALVATGVVFSLNASSAAADLEAAAAAHEAWSDDFASKEDAGRSDATISLVTLSVGAAAIAAGGVMYVLGSKAAAENPKAAQRIDFLPAIGPATASVTFRLRF